MFNILPWYLNAPDSYNIYCSVPGITKHFENISLKARIGTKKVENHHTNYIIYTDGLATLG